MNIPQQTAREQGMDSQGQCAEPEVCPLKPGCELQWFYWSGFPPVRQLDVCGPCPTQSLTSGKDWSPCSRNQPVSLTMLCVTLTRTLVRTESPPYFIKTTL